MDLQYGATSVRVRFVVVSAATGAKKTGLTPSTSGLIISVIADNSASPTIYAQASGNIETIGTLGTWAAPTSSKCRFKEVSSTNHPGLYEFQFADAVVPALGSSARTLTVSISGGDASGDYEIRYNTLGKILSYVQLLSRTDTAVATDLAADLTQLNANLGSGAGSYDNTKTLVLTDQARDNMNTFFDNDDAPTSEIVDNVGERDSVVLQALPLKKNTGSQHIPFYMRDSSDPRIGKTGVPTITKSLDGTAAWSSTSGTVTEIGNGAVDFSPSTTDCNATLCRYKAVLSGAITQIVDVYTHD